MVSLLKLDISVRGPDGAPVHELALVTLSTIRGGVFRQATTMAGHAEFQDVPPDRYSVQVVAPGFEKAMQEFEASGFGTTMVMVELQPASEKAGPVNATPPIILAPKAQKELDKALAALRENKLGDAQSHLETAKRLAPNHPEVNYLLGVYSVLKSDWTGAQSYLKKTLEFVPTHSGALLSLSEVLLRINKSGEALPYLKRTVEAEPTSWRAHALLANAEFQQGANDEAVQHAERALELGHAQAAAVQPLLAAALAKRGDPARAKDVLQAYVQEHPQDTAAKRQLEKLQAPRETIFTNAASALPEVKQEVKTEAATAPLIDLPLISNWLPPDIDEKIPPVESGVACALDDLLGKTEKRVQEFVGNVDRFTATETLIHESVNKAGLSSSPERRQFDYVVGIREVRKGLLNVDEYRRSGSGQTDFPDGVITSGLPALILIFHPYNIVNFQITCEGLTRWNGGLAWQLHFRQRADKPNTIRSYKLGLQGSSYDVALKGRAWIAAESYQVLRLETDLVAPLPEIRLFADHIAIEYAPVHFQERKVDMWLPQNAEVYFDWRGRRSHRRHSFSKYMLFSVDDRQHISAPKALDETPPSMGSEVPKQNP
jgi:tetratricopeptide (TPR) repeat protein